MEISAKVVAHSVSPEGKEIVTYELEFPRFILAQMNTHKILTSNTASSRAIPVKKVIDLVEDNPVVPVYWGKNKSGMQAEEELSEKDKEEAIDLWMCAKDSAVSYAKQLNELGVHKELVNRILEPFTMTKMVITGTEWDNFFWLRDDKDAQNEIQHVAKKIKEAYNKSTPKPLEVGEWHLPYFENGYWSSHSETSLEDAIKISTSCCAQVSYRNLDDSLEKAERIYGMLGIGEKGRVHASPLSHLATPIDLTGEKVPDGVTHVHSILGPMSGNLAGWLSYRQMVEGTTYWGEENC